MKRRIKVGLRLGGAHRDVDVGRRGEVVCSSPTQCRPVFGAGIANSIMPAKATIQMTSASLKFNAVVRGLILGVIITLGASVSGGLVRCPL